MFYVRICLILEPPDSMQKSHEINMKEIVFYGGLALAVTVILIIIYVIIRLVRRKPTILCLRRYNGRSNGELNESASI